MITVSILSGNHTPAEEGLPFQLISLDGTPPGLLCSASTDPHGVVSFDVDVTGIAKVGVRLDAEALDKRQA